MRTAINLCLMRPAPMRSRQTPQTWRFPAAQRDHFRAIIAETARIQFGPYVSWDSAAPETGLQILQPVSAPAMASRVLHRGDGAAAAKRPTLAWPAGTQVIAQSRRSGGTDRQLIFVRHRHIVDDERGTDTTERSMRQTRILWLILVFTSACRSSPINNTDAGVDARAEGLDANTLPDLALPCLFKGPRACYDQGNCQGSLWTKCELGQCCDRQGTVDPATCLCTCNGEPCTPPEKRCCLGKAPDAGVACRFSIDCAK